MTNPSPAIRSSLTNHYPVGRHGNSESCSLTIKEVTSQIWQICTWPDTSAKVSKAVNDIIAMPLPETGQWLGNDKANIMWAGASRYHITAQSAELYEQLKAAIPSTEGSLLDLSHSRTIIEVEGAATLPLIAKGSVADLREITSSDVILTSFDHHYNGSVRFLSREHCQIYVTTTTARSFFEWLCEAATEFGYEILPQDS